MTILLIIAIMLLGIRTIYLQQEIEDIKRELSFIRMMAEVTYDDLKDLEGDV